VAAAVATDPVLGARRLTCAAVIALREAECCALAGTHYRSTTRRAAASRPQPKRAPLGASGVSMMKRRFTFRTTLLKSAPLIAAASCLSAVRSAPAPEEEPTVCYQLTFGTWVSASPTPFATSAVGLVSPLPDTIALTKVVTTSYGRASYLARRVPTDSTYPTGTWTRARPDMLVVAFSSDAGNKLVIRLRGTGTQLKGEAWVSADQHTAGKVLYDPVGPPPPAAPVTAAQGPCPAGTSSSPPGA
jgi:hypothetical protein